jgi:hypothetical protein
VVGVLLAAILVLALAGWSALAFDAEGPNGERVVELLGDAGVTTDLGELDHYADTYGLGGAVRILAWAEAAGVDPSDIAAMFDAGMGWGQIARALAEEHPEFHLGPGIGWVMGGKGHGHGQGNAHGHGWGPGGNPNGGDGDPGG